jgi:hypothetical protein
MNSSKPVSAPETGEPIFSAYALQNGAEESPAGSADTEAPYIFALLAAGGIPAAVAAGFLCRPTASMTPFWVSLVLQAAIYVFVTMAIGSLGAWLLWACLAMEPSFSLRSFLWNTGTCWGFIPVLVLLYRLHSVWLLAMSLVMAAYLVVCVRRMQSQEQEERDRITAARGSGVPVPAFRTVEVSRGRYWRQIWISITVQAALLLMMLGSFRLACALLAIPALSLAWQITSRQSIPVANADRRRVLLPVLVAVIATTIVILPQFNGAAFAISDRNRVFAKPQSQNGQGARQKSYVSVILWPPLVKKARLLPPAPHVSSTGLFSSSKPMVIPFNGPYWYFQAPDTKPGATAHVMHGSPIDENIHSNNFLPLFMTAHQALDTPIDMESCRELDLAVINADKSPGEIDVGVLLTDTATKRSQYLGKRPIPSSMAPEFSIHRGPVQEKLRFHVLHGELSRFDDITVLINPEMDRSLAGARVAVKEFELIPK